jgi:hypothetical protein
VNEQDNTGGPAAIRLPVDLRDYFAAKAMQGELSSMTDPDIGGLSLSITSEGLANLAKHWYRIADAMLEARKS